MVEDGRTLSEAAQMAALQEESLRKALRKPHVAQFVTGLRREWLAGQTILSFHKVAELRDDAQSQKVQLDACKTILQSAGELQPTERDTGPRAGVLVQIVIPTREGPPPVLTNGVWESPPFDPRTYVRPAPVIDHVDAAEG